MSQQPNGRDQDELQETRELVKAAFALAGALGIRTMLVQADEITDRHMVQNLRGSERVIWIARDRNEIPASDPVADVVLVMPDAPLNRLSQLNFALFLSALNGLITSEERVLGLSGIAGSRRLDTLVIARPARDYPWLQRHKAEMKVSRHLVS
jgi:hypothetical protein